MALTKISLNLLPDLPLPSVKGMIGVIARVPTKRSRNTSKTDENGHHDADLGFTPASTPHIPHDSAYTDDEMLRLVYFKKSPCKKNLEK